jgi:cytochrome P450 family 4 subfamily V
LEHLIINYTDDGRILPKGVDILISIADMNRDPESFPNPDEFDPERFSPERVGYLHPSAFIPFSLGIRNCIGNFLNLSGKLKLQDN